MKYFVHVRQKELSDFSSFEDKVTIERGTLVADIWRVEWFGLKRTLICKGLAADRIEYEAAIKHDMLTMKPLHYDFKSQTKRTENNRIW